MFVCPESYAQCRLFSCIREREFGHMPENLYATDNVDFQSLLSQGFSETEAAKLVYMRDHSAEQVEYREIVKESRHLDFIRWLIEHDRMSH